MADTCSFDITTGCDLQEVDNAVNQARKELTQRYDFRNVTFTIELKRSENQLHLTAPDEFKLEALWDVLQTKMIRRGVPVKNLQRQDAQGASGMTLRQQIDLTQGIDADTSRAIVKFIKEQKLKKVQAAMQKDQLRISGPSRDDLQQVMSLLRQQDFGLELTFGNYR